MGNDGSGWSMSVWPRNTKRVGDDYDGAKGKKVVKARTSTKPARARNVAPKKKRDPEKFARALAEAIGPKAARRYINRYSRKSGD